MCAATSGAVVTLRTSAISFAVTAAGVRAGATRPTQEVASKPASPCSAMVGRPASAGGRVAPALASARTLRLSICGRLAGNRSKNIWIWPPIRSFMAGAVPR